MEKLRDNLTVRIAAIGALFVAAVMIIGTIWTGRSAGRDSEKAARSVSLLYMDELAGRREQVVEDNLKDKIEQLEMIIGMMSEEDFSDLEHLQSYITKMKTLFKLDRFALVDSNGLIYTSTGTETDIANYSFNYHTISGPDISVNNINDDDKKIVIAIPVSGISFEGEAIVAAFMELDMQLMLKGVSIETQNTDATYCNIYTSDGIPLSNTVLGGAATETNLFDALSNAEFDGGYSLDMLSQDFAEGKRGIISFTYNGTGETLSYVPVSGTDWFLTYLIRESVINEVIAPVSEGILRRSTVLSLMTAFGLGLMFAFIIHQIRRNNRLLLEKETSEAENRVKHQEMEQRLALQEQLLEQKREQEQMEALITALSSNYRSVYYVELDNDRGICYQARTDLQGFRTGDDFNYLESVTAYCNRYILEQYREPFLRFIQPDAIREGLKENRVISYRYMINVDGRESYEAVMFAGVRHPEDRDDHMVHSVGACFADVDAETREALEQQQALSEALATAEQASKAKTAFLSNMSHEIRTPMNAIIGLNNIALNEPDVPDKIEEYLLKIGASAQHLLGIINDILDMSRIESGRMVIKNEDFSFAKNLEQVNTIISGQCADKGLTYDCHIVGKIDDYYVGDGVKLKQVMINILGNSVKFTPPGGKVSFIIEELRRFAGQVTLKMIFSDTGIGMSKDYLPHIFEAFSQEDGSSTNRYGSTGLGMPITKSIVELMNGHIEVESEKGKGSTFTVTVTLGESDRTEDGGSDGQIDPKNMSVLVIDDDPIALEHAQIILGQSGIKCDIAGSGAEAVEMVNLRHGRMDDYDLLLMDWKMPDMDGVETTRRIRSIVGMETPIIILTSYNWDDVADEARAAGVDTFVPKPLFVNSVLDEFRAVFNQKKESGRKAPADLKGRHVLLAEDVAVNAEIMVMVMSMREINVDIAENGRIAVEMFEKQPEGYYDAILMDMRMPEMDGLEATRTIRALPREDAASIPIIALTANAFDEDVQRSLQAGLNAHLSKPVEPDTLFETLENLIV